MSETVSDPYRAELAGLVATHGPTYRRHTVIWLMVGVFPIVMSATVINVAIPDIRHWFLASNVEVQALSSAFLAAMTIALLVSAGLIGKLGVRRAYGWLVAGFMATSLLAALLPPPALPMLIALRVAQGFICGSTQALAMLVIIGIHPPERRGRAISMYGLGITFSPTIGPFVGGMLTSLIGWQSVFVFSLPLCLLSWRLVRSHLPLGAPADLPRSLRLTPVLWLVVFMAGLLASFVWWHASGPSTAFASIAVAVLGFALFVRDQLVNRKRTVLDFSMLKIPGVRAATLIGFAYGAGLFGSTYLLPVYFQDLGGWSSFQSGLVLLPGGVLLGAALYAGGMLSDSLSVRWTLLAGLLLFLLSNAAFLWWLQPVTVGLVLAFTMLGRIGLGLTIPSLTAGAMMAAPDSHSSTVTVLVNFARSLGGAIGVGLVGLLLDTGFDPAQVSPAAREAAYWNAFALMTLCFVPALIAWYWMGAKAPRRADSQPAATTSSPDCEK